MRTCYVNTKDELYIKIYKQAKTKHEDLLILESAYVGFSNFLIGFDYIDKDGNSSWFMNVSKATIKYEFITTI